MGLFDNRKPLSRPSLRQILQKDSGKIPDSSLKRYSLRERASIEKNTFNYRKYGSHISGQDYKRAVGDLEKQRMWSKSYAERREIKNKISYLKGIDQGKK